MGFHGPLQGQPYLFALVEMRGIVKPMTSLGQLCPIAAEQWNQQVPQWILDIAGQL
jgi:hypothetical protein